jgi:hypothetical protein
MKKNLFLFFVLLAICWTVWLAYQAYTVADPVVVSGPQLQLASVVIVAEVKPVANGPVTGKIIKVYKNQFKELRQLPAEIKIIWPTASPLPGQGTTYLLPLHPFGAQPSNDLFEVVRVSTGQRLLDPEVYRFTESVRLQAEMIMKK